ncbi:long chain fatty acid-CoA synthetase [Mycobacterium palustre]|uniref:Long chain fatty acid-CoA synthetase Faa4p n=1 Tax=Mycobacterium palustre TaxID=153971 RepID=A0A1X1ZUV3_9MYCO|nr:long chain fatty acid-CoA synthetase [Mycobacterium palustre]MCV7101783.1 long chain fatty acid-CoA synthetase [Mycobacterium palustre]ORW27817.1 long chain fatty acid-CoA synthetase Faa4p [Mycobacterium palustre]
MRRTRTRRTTQLVKCPTVGQCFDIEVTRHADGWTVRVPEIGGLVRVASRAAAELAARKYIAARTGIPIGYVTVFVTNEIACAPSSREASRRP